MPQRILILLRFLARFYFLNAKRLRLRFKHQQRQVVHGLRRRRNRWYRSVRNRWHRVVGRSGDRVKRKIRRQFRRLHKAIQHVPMAVGVAFVRVAPQGLRAAAVDGLLEKPVVVDTPHGAIRFFAHGKLSYGRATKLMAKEPDSLKWIDRMEDGGVLWDIGANIGTLTLYAARRETLKIWSFEPAASNYYNLAANCELNGYSKEVTCLQIGFSNHREIGVLNTSQFALGGSFSFKGFTKRKDFAGWQAVELWTIDEFIRSFGVPCPNYIKIDVPGLQNEILAGAEETLSRPELKQLQIETQETGRGGRHIIPLLKQRGFEISHRQMRYHKDSAPVQRDLVFSRVS